eukprot:Em0011g1215a
MDVCRCLCSLFLLATLQPSGAQSINVVITGGPSSPATFGAITSYTLTCIAGPNPTNVTWITPPAGMMGPLTTSGSNSSRILTLSSSSAPIICRSWSHRYGQRDIRSFSGFTYYSTTLTFSTLSSQDNNMMYQCRVGTLYTPYFTQYSSSPTSTATILVNALVLSPTITSTCQQGVLQLNCTADKPLSVVPPLMLSWFRSSVGNGTFSPLDPGLPGINVSRTPSGSNTSTLSIAGSSVSGSYVYRCMAVVAIPDDAPVAANVTSGVMSLSISGVVSGLALQSYGQLSRIVWEVPVVNCNRVSYYTVAMTTYADGTLIETGTTTDQNYTLTKNYTAGVPYKANSVGIIWNCSWRKHISNHIHSGAW